MKKEEEFEAEFEEEFEEFDGFEEFEEFGEIEEVEAIEMKTAILAKNNMIALLCVKTATQGGAICRVDPREERPAVQVYDNAAAALEWYEKSLRTSRQNGWNIVYNGLPLYG